jgi:hypothetical protein
LTSVTHFKVQLGLLISKEDEFGLEFVVTPDVFAFCVFAFTAFSAAALFSVFAILLSLEGDKVRSLEKT